MSTTLPGTTGVEQQDVDEARAFNAQLEALIATQPLVYTLAPEVSRRARREGKGIFPAPVFLEEARDIEIAGRGGPIKVRIIRPGIHTRPAQTTVKTRSSICSSTEQSSWMLRPGLPLVASRPERICPW